MKHSKRRDLARHLKGFLQRKARVQRGESLLLALSGGPDSLALFYALLECQLCLSFSFAVAHVDHSWRESSQRESAELEKLAGDNSIPFHCKKLEDVSCEGNAEAKCREERLNFFSDLCSESDYKGVLLGHHRNDQAETVLKKLFEGGTLLQCQAMHEIAHHSEITLLRPWLSIPKQEILEWLEAKGRTPFYDQTNLDTRFMRGRMRKAIIPDLEEHFGKKITNALAALHNQAEELEEYLQMKLAAPLSQLKKDPALPLLFDTRPHTPLHPLEMKYLVKQAMRKSGCPVVNALVDQCADHLIRGSYDKYFHKSSYCLKVHGGLLTISLTGEKELL